MLTFLLEVLKNKFLLTAIICIILLSGRTASVTSIPSWLKLAIQKLILSICRNPLQIGLFRISKPTKIAHRASEESSFWNRKRSLNKCSLITKNEKCKSKIFFVQFLKSIKITLTFFHLKVLCVGEYEIQLGVRQIDSHFCRWCENQIQSNDQWSTRFCFSEFYN